ncbi:MAG: hypothetical protein HRU19_10785 [Pseudobacteriovorax sp.]|nr:hypothetical protein [Pseudobacteriovorax sp.]
MGNESKNGDDNVIKFRKPKRSGASAADKRTLNGKKPLNQKSAKPKAKYSFAHYIQLFLVLAIGAYLMQQCRGG